MSLSAATPGDAPALAAMHATAFDRPWGASEIGDLMTAPGAFGLVAGDSGFILCRAIAGEAEVLTLAVTPAARRQGVGRALLEAATTLAAAAGADSMFLEVAAGNVAALALYAAAGFSRVGMRRGYYADGADAVVMRRALNTSA